jgi:DNA-binding MarR family transcriptional regulator
MAPHPARDPAGSVSAELIAEVASESGSPLEEAFNVFRGWLYLPNAGFLAFVLGVIAANRLDGESVWGLGIGPPGGGKSEILNSVSQLDDAHPAGTLTEASLLSGTPRKDRATGSKGGLLHEIGEHGIIVCYDFGSVLSMNRDARAAVLAALREIYDGSWTRHVGTDGGKTLSWSGKVGLVGGCTPTIDRHHAVMGAMGERFTLYRLPEVDSDIQARAALHHAGRERAMRAELAEAARAAVARLTPPRERTEEETETLIALATFVVRARSAVERDGYSREIELVPDPEAPTRLVVVLDRLLAGLDAIGCDRRFAFRIITKAALDSIPALRLACLRSLENEETLNSNEVGAAVRYPTSTARRALEDLTAHGLVERQRQETANQAHQWRLSEFARSRLARFPEVSEGPEGLFKSRSAQTTTFRESMAAELSLFGDTPPRADDDIPF